MCNEYAREIALAKFLEELAKAKQMAFECRMAGFLMISTQSPV